ncbi:MAG: D-alanine--D-alanine ligase [Verrucomicrobia bacterium 61-8]|nr:D-alanine--D-alanine ligase [Verrucomicrobiota bacterium]OJV16340.1 MAG: D-alanine--D-alanine ligase [Verrucomicrobia bacterium 61-8]
MSSGILNDKVVAVLMGGPGAEREVSLRSGAAVARALGSLGAKVVEIDVTGPDFPLPTDVHLAYNMIHGTFGEDGQLQAILDAKGVPYTGEGARGSRLAFDKIESKRKFDEAGVPTAAFEVIERGVQPGLTAPYVIKAPRQGSSVGVHIIHDTAHVPAALEDCFQFGNEVLVEDFVKGRELTIGILGGKALPVIEIVPNEGFYDYAHKYTKGASSYFVPADIGEENTRRVQEAAEAAHAALGLEIYSRVDILLASDGSLSVLEINTIPGMTETSLLPKAAAVVGLDFAALCERIAELSLARHNR